MEHGERSGGQPYNWRHAPRIALSIPVAVKRRGEGDAAPMHAQSVNLSTGGVYVTIAGGARIASGDILAVSIAIPWESRRAFPFSRVAASGRVVRVDRLDRPDSLRTGLALAFCGSEVSLIGAAMVPA